MLFYSLDTSLWFKKVLIGDQDNRDKAGNKEAAPTQFFS